MQNTKTALLEYCKSLVFNRLNSIQKTIDSNKTALNSETKSSAGDKHETGRAMLQLEMEKSGKQFLTTQQMLLVLQQIKPNSSKKICLGSLINTTNGTYFLATSLGVVKYNLKEYYIVSTKSPIGKLLLGKNKGMSIHFNGEIKILEVL